MIMGTTIRVTTLDVDTPVPNVHAKQGKYSDIFAKLLEDAAPCTAEHGYINLWFSAYDCVAGDFPSSQDLKEIYGIIITGSCECASCGLTLHAVSLTVPQQLRHMKQRPESSRSKPLF